MMKQQDRIRGAVITRYERDVFQTACKTLALACANVPCSEAYKGREKGGDEKRKKKKKEKTHLPPSFCFMACIHRSTLAAVYFAVAIETAELQGSNNGVWFPVHSCTHPSASNVPCCNFKVRVTATSCNTVPGGLMTGIFISLSCPSS